MESSGGCLLPSLLIVIIFLIIVTFLWICHTCVPGNVAWYQVSELSAPLRSAHHKRRSLLGVVQSLAPQVAKSAYEQ